MSWKFDDNSVQAISVLEGIKKEFLEDATRIIHRQVVQNTRVDTGQTKESWKKVIEEDKGMIGSTSQNAVWEEFGTGHYAINGDGRKTPWYVPVEGYLGDKKPTYNGQVIIVYGKNGKAYYKTNGKRPTRALYNAELTTREKIQRRLESLVKEKL